MPDISDDFSFDPRDVERVVKREHRQSLRRCRRQEHPEAILLAGQPGAGKTELTAAAMAERFSDSCMSINGDDYRRFHPDHRNIIARYGDEAADHFSRFSSAVTESLIDVFSDEGFNLIIEGTCRTVEVPERTAKILFEKGYRVEIAALAVHPVSSLLSTAIRLYRMCEHGTVPRVTSIEAHDHVVEVLPGNLDYLSECAFIDDISIWNRNMDCLYRRSVSDELPSAIIKKQWERTFSEEELRWMKDMYSDISGIELRENLGQERLLQVIAERLSVL